MSTLPSPTQTRWADLWTVGLTLLAAVLLASAIVLSPARVATVVPLDWTLGNITPVVQALRGALLLCSGAILVWRSPLALALRQMRARDVLVSAGLVMVSLVATLTLAEWALRHEGYPFSGSWTPSETAIAQFDSDVGWSYIPGLSATQPFGRQRRLVAMHFDRFGVRVDHPGRTFSRTAPSILFIGDSFTFGHGVSYEEAFPAQVESLLGGRVQTVNLGVQGYGTDQALLSLQRCVNRFNARVIVYTYIADHIRRNDNYDRRLLYPDGKWPGSKPLFGLRADGTAVLRKRPESVASLNTLHLAQVAQLAWARWGPRPDPGLTTALLRELKRFCDERGMRLLVVNWPRSNDRRPDNGRAAPRLVDPGVLKDAGVEVLDLSQDAPSGWRTWRIPGDGHPTPEAHERAARLIVQRLSTLVPGLVTTP